MPTYEYRCKACKHEFEEFQSMSAKLLKKCPECGKPALERLIGTGAALVFKGSGFYQTDYRSEGYKKAAASDKPAESAKPADSKAESKADSKTESKPEPKAEKPVESKTEKKAKPKKEAKP